MNPQILKLIAMMSAAKPAQAGIISGPQGAAAQGYVRPRDISYPGPAVDNPDGPNGRNIGNLLKLFLAGRDQFSDASPIGSAPGAGTEKGPYAGAYPGGGIPLPKQ